MRNLTLIKSHFPPVLTSNTFAEEKRKMAGFSYRVKWNNFFCKFFQFPMTKAINNRQKVSHANRHEKISWMKYILFIFANLLVIQTETPMFLNLNQLKIVWKRSDFTKVSYLATWTNHLDEIQPQLVDFTFNSKFHMLSWASVSDGHYIHEI